MCLILFSHDNHPHYRLVLLANRDEFYKRPTAGLSFWEDAPQVLGGRDLEAGGTWLAISTRGRLAAITNYRDPSTASKNGPSRGALVADFVTGDEPPEDYLERVSRLDNRYDGYNLIVGDPGGLYYHSNRGSGVAAVAPGSHGLSNHLLDTPWPKVSKGVDDLKRLLQGGRRPELEDYFSLLSDDTPFPDADLPQTGVGLAWERLLSPRFIVSPQYGTRSSAVILIDRQGQVTFAERRTDPARGGSAARQTCRFDLAIPSWSAEGGHQGAAVG
jgi:uncharacterized protein with NRDE domain